MDILFNKATLLFIAIFAVAAFLVYSVTLSRRIGVIAYFKLIGHVGKVIISILGAFVTSLVALLAAGTKTSDAKETSDIAPSGGVLNYRTSKLDDGTDPVGWYEKD